jgi:hypothetical protein
VNYRPHGPAASAGAHRSRKAPRANPSDLLHVIDRYRRQPRWSRPGGPGLVLYMRQHGLDPLDHGVFEWMGALARFGLDTRAQMDFIESLGEC